MFRQKNYISLSFVILILIFSISACSNFVQINKPDTNGTPPELIGPPVEAMPTSTVTFTKTPNPTNTSAPPATPIPTATLHPMSIMALRQMSFPGSEIVMERELDPGSNYRRFYAYYMSEGFKIYGLLTIPNGNMPNDGWPAIIFNHGYIPPDEYRTTERYIAYVDWIARSQYIVFRIDYRGHDQSEGEASGAYGSPGYAVDVLNAVASMKIFPQANREKIGMWGHSMGGYLTLRAMVTDPDIKAGVIWAGVVASYPDMLNLWRRNSTGPTPTAPSFARRWRQAWVEEFGSPEENPDFWRSVSSNSYVSEISGPVQLHHGTSDEDVPIVFSELLWQELLAANKTVEFYTYEGDNHNLSNYFSAAMTRTIAFFNQYLK